LNYGNLRNTGNSTTDNEENIDTAIVIFFSGIYFSIKYNKPIPIPAATITKPAIVPSKSVKPLSSFKSPLAIIKAPINARPPPIKTIRLNHFLLTGN